MDDSKHKYQYNNNNYLNVYFVRQGSLEIWLYMKV